MLEGGEAVLVELESPPGCLLLVSGSEELGRPGHKVPSLKRVDSAQSLLLVLEVLGFHLRQLQLLNTVLPCSEYI